MKLSRKNLGRVATTFLATAMLASLTAVPAMAEPAKYVTSTTNSFSFNAGITLADENTPYAPDVDITYELTGTSIPFADEALAKPGKDEAILNTSDKVAEIEGTTTFANVSFDFDMTKFDAPGIYYYELTATVPQVTGLQAKNETYIVKVYVKNNANMTGYEISNVTMYKDAEYENPEDADDSKIGDLTGNDSAATYTAEALTLTKALAGDMANKSDVFGFTIVIEDPDVNKYASQVKYSVNGVESEDPVVFTEEGVATVTVPANAGIGDKQSIIVYGVPTGADVTITEADKGYNNGHEITNDYSTSWENATKAESNDKIATTEVEDTKTVKVTNTKDAVTPTGIAMDIAPYALLVVIAAAGCFVFLRKRNED